MNYPETGILQWNIWYRQDIRDIARALREFPGGPPPIVCLQELTRDFSEQGGINTWRLVADELGYDHHVDEVPVHGMTADWVQAVAIFSLYGLHDRVSAKVHIPDDPDSPLDQYRSYVEAAVTTPSGGELTIATTHLSVPNGDFPGRRTAEIARLEERVRRRRRFGILGDMNDGLGSAVISMLDSHLVHAGPDFSHGTWPRTDETDADGDVVPALSRRLDVAYFSDDVDVISSESVDLGVSDHLGVYCRLRV